MMDDHQLLSAYFQGDERAFESLVEKYFPMVYGVASRHTGDSHLGEEIAQSVFLILSRKAPGLSARTSIPGWLLRTTRFVCWDAIKSRRRREQNEKKLAMKLEAQADIARDTSTVELLLEEAIQTLRPEEQAGIVARFFEGKDFQEIAEMFAITEEAARKRTARCLAKLESFMARRGARVSSQALSALLMAPPLPDGGLQSLPAALQAAHAAWRGKMATDNVVALANHTARVLRWRALAKLSFKAGVPVLLIVLGAWAMGALNRPLPRRLERLGRQWGQLDELVARHRQFLQQTPANALNYQARVQQDLETISRESSRVIQDLNPLLAQPNERAHLAQFLTAELTLTLSLNASSQTNLFSYIRNRLSDGASLQAAMKALAQSTQTEALEIKAMLSPAQRQVFDQIYGSDGALLFSYAQAVALGRIGP